MAEVIWGGLDALIERCNALTKKTPERVATLIEHIGKEAKDVMDAATPTRTGLLKSNNQVEVQGTTFHLVNLTPYAGFVEFGTRFMAAEPFMTPAMEVAQQAFMEQSLNVFEE